MATVYAKHLRAISAAILPGSRAIFRNGWWIVYPPSVIHDANCKKVGAE